MPLIVYPKKNESSRRLIRRFSRVLRKTGILRKAKRARFWQRPLSKTKKKIKALKREETKKKYANLEKRW